MAWHGIEVGNFYDDKVIEGLLFAQLLGGISVQFHNDYMNLFHISMACVFVDIVFKWYLLGFRVFDRGFSK